MSTRGDPSFPRRTATILKRHGPLEIIEKEKQAELLLDGAVGSMLIARGLKGGDGAERWTVDHPEVFQENHRGR